MTYRSSTTTCPKPMGQQVLKRVRQHSRDTPVIMMTGQGSEPVAVQAMKERAHDYIIKSGQHGTTLPLIICKAVGTRRLLLEHERMEQEITRLKRQLTILNAIAQIVSQPLDLQQVLGEALPKTLELMAAGGGMPVDLLQHASRT